jgi:hypothetical protein
LRATTQDAQILSRFAGAAAECTATLLVNPYDPGIPGLAGLEPSEAGGIDGRRRSERHGLFRCGAFVAAGVCRPSIQNVRIGILIPPNTLMLTFGLLIGSAGTALWAFGFVRTPRPYSRLVTGCIRALRRAWISKRFSPLRREVSQE